MSEKYNFNSKVNQDIKGKFVNREVYCQDTLAIETLLRMSYQVLDDDLPTYDEIENFCSYPEYYGNHIEFEGGSYEECQEKIQEIEEEIDTLEKESTDIEYLDNLKEEFQELKNLEDTPAEIFQWFIVSDYLGEKLKEKCQCILEYGGNYFWGRTCFGQAILLDNVISEICSEMKILDGMENSWATK